MVAAVHNNSQQSQKSVPQKIPFRNCTSQRSINSQKVVNQSVIIVNEFAIFMPSVLRDKQMKATEIIRKTRPVLASSEF